MKVVVQRVTKAHVSVNNEIITSIGKGLSLLVGISKNDTKEDMDYIIRKVLNVRLFENEQSKKWSSSIIDKQYEILCVSQFTLCSEFKGNKLTFHHAMEAENSRKFYEQFLTELGKQYKPEKIKDGKFGAYMQVHIENDGPVTINIESQRKTERNPISVDPQ